MDINYELYKVFYYVATSLNFSEASKQLFISQSAVSQSIKTLEKKLEQPLFIRSTKKVQLTPAGKVLLKHIEPAMNLIQRGENQLLDSGSMGLGQLHIGASDTICRYYLVPYLNKLGADITVKNQTATIIGPTKLKGCDVVATDLRAGAAMVAAGLVAEGKTVITNAEHILRGYELIIEKLTEVGAKIKLKDI